MAGLVCWAGLAQVSVLGQVEEEQTLISCGVLAGRGAGSGAAEEGGSCSQPHPSGPEEGEGCAL